jgi:hypothetical protein
MTKAGIQEKVARGRYCHFTVQGVYTLAMQNVFSSSLESMCLLSMFVALNSKDNHIMFQCSCHMVHLNCQTLARLSWCINHAKLSLKYENEL